MASFPTSRLLCPPRLPRLLPSGHHLRRLSHGEHLTGRSCHLHARAEHGFAPLCAADDRGRSRTPSALELLRPIGRRTNPPGVTARSWFNFGGPSRSVAGPEIVQAGDPVLHEPCARVDPGNILSDQVQSTIDSMVATMRAAPGVGLSANQIGVPLQILVAEDTKDYMRGCDPEQLRSQQREPFELLVIVNPVLKPVGTQKARFFEGCLSVDGYRGLVERNLEVQVSGFDREGRPLTVTARGWQARILQHEYDHLQGLTYVDKVVPRSFRTVDNLLMPLASTCPKIGNF